jgi:hypothetical protein
MGLALRRGAACYRELRRISLPRTSVNKGKPEKTWLLIPAVREFIDNSLM